MGYNMCTVFTAIVYLLSSIVARIIEIERPRIVNITDTTVRIAQTVELKVHPHLIVFYYEGKNGYALPNSLEVEQPLEKPHGSSYEKTFTGLIRNSWYTVYTNVYGPNDTNIAKSLQINFTNAFIGKRCFEVVSKNSSLVLKLDRDPKGCEALKDGSYYMELRNEAQNLFRPYNSSTFPFTFKNLTPHTDYKLTVYDSSGGTILWIKEIQTLPSDYYLGPRVFIKHNLAWLTIFLPVLVVCMLILSIFICHRNCKRGLRQPKEISYTDLISTSVTGTSVHDSTTLYPTTSLRPRIEAVGSRESDNIYTLPNEPDSCPVKIGYFPEYVKTGTAKGLLYSQFMMLRRGLTRPCEYGRLPENMPKNRYEDLIAYDDTRVVLEKIPGYPYSDYINANYVKGYRNGKNYIAAQGPTPDTVNDFWRMIWQEEVQVICMLTNLIEDDEIKCAKYWPEHGTKIMYGNFLVSNIDDQVFLDYTFRTFELSYGRDRRTVTHLHYTGWPSQGIPTNRQSFVKYMKKLEQTPAGNGFVVVHCSTGSGRTGTVILCDICLRRAAVEEVVNVTAVVTRMQDCRADMVGTLQQYLLAHIVITECLTSWPTQIPCTDDFSTRVKEMRMQLVYDVERLNDAMWREEALHSLAVRKLADGHQTASFQPAFQTFESKNSHINAVSVNGIEGKEKYLVHCLPSSHALSNFWRYIADRNIEMIVILQCSNPGEPTCCDIMPDESILFPVSHVQVEKTTSHENREYFTHEKLVLTDTSETQTRSQFVTVLTCKGWEHGGNGKPPKPEALISLWEASEEILRKKGRTLVLCYDGVTGCGLYLALTFLLDKIAAEGECDVISAVRTVRQCRLNFVHSLEQFEYLYDAAVKYVESFHTYANLSWWRTSNS